MQANTNNDENSNDELDYFDEETQKQLKLEIFLMKELDSTLKFKEEVEEYVYNNYLPFLRKVDMTRLRNLFL